MFLLYRKRNAIRQLSHQSINYSAFLIASLIPTSWVMMANVGHYVLRGQVFLGAHRLVAVGVCILWGCVIAWAANVPQVLYIHRPGGKNKVQQRLFIASVIGLLVSLISLLILGIIQSPPVQDHRILMYVVSSFVVLGLAPLIRGCAKPWRYIFITDPRGVYVAYTGQVLQPNTLYRTGLTWKTPALDHFMETAENKISQLRFKDGAFELRYDATVNFPETPSAPEEWKLDSAALFDASSEFLYHQLQSQCAKFTGMQCMKMLQGLKPVEEYVEVPVLEPEGHQLQIRMRWSGKFKLSDI